MSTVAAQNEPGLSETERHKNLKPVLNLTRDDVSAIQNLRSFVRVRFNGFNTTEKYYLDPIMRQVADTLNKLEDCLQ